MRSIVGNAVLNSDAIQDLLNNKGVEGLAGQFGFYGSSTAKQCEAIVKSVEESTEVIFKPFDIKYNGSLTVNVQPSDLANLLALPEGHIITKNHDLHWLDWLLTMGDTIVVVGYDYNPQTGIGRSRKGNMIKPGSWRVPPEFSGVEDHNFITKALQKKSTVEAVQKVMYKSLS